VRTGPVGSGIALVTAGKRVGSLDLRQEPLDPERWERLREAVVPHLATAIASADLVEQIRRTHVATIAALSRAIEAKDCYTGGHTERVSALSVALAKRLGFSEADVQTIEVGALLHDIGKIGTPERVLNKPGPLDAAEWEIMKQHPVVSDYILSEADLPPLVRQIARWTHERVDGRGYPDGLTGDEIPLAARIVFVADAFDALTSDRPYRPARHARAALDELRANSGTQFCPAVVEVLTQVFEEQPELVDGPPLRAVEVA
jgi:putative nucleotidyltransferase with HDIG domain